MIGPVSHDPLQLHDALQRTTRPVVFDVETTGLHVRTDHILSLGFRIYLDGAHINFIIFTDRCSHRSIRPYVHNWTTIAHALTPLSRPGVILIGHNIKYDLLMLRREGVAYRGETRDTQALLRLEDQDRVFTKETAGRRYLTAPAGRQWSNYTLKDAAFHLLGIAPQYTPSPNMDLVPYETHAIYLAHDIYVTHKLHSYLWQGLSASLRRHSAVQSALTQLFCDMRWHGVVVDGGFIKAEVARLDSLKAAISNLHRQRHGRLLLGMTDDDLRGLLYQTYRLPCRRRPRSKPSIKAEVIRELRQKTANPNIQASLALISEFRETDSLRRRLDGYGRAIETDGRLHSQFDNRQASGRVSSSKPNLQQIARAKTILKGDPLEATFRCRDLVMPSAGCVIVAADVAQADVRVLGHEIDRCAETTQEHFMRLQRERFGRLRQAAELWRRREAYANDAWQGQAAPAPKAFDPHAASPLVQNFQQASGDFYSLVASEVTGQSVAKTDPARNTWKTILLAQINSETATGLAKRWKCTRAEAQKLVDRFFAAFPDIASWTDLQRQQVALAGETYTWGGRRRRNTAHYWMVSQKRVRLLLVYKNHRHRWRYWFDVTPVRPTQRYLTCLVHRVWNIADEQGAKPARLIYELDRGRLGSKAYRHLDEAGRFLLPFRNIPWRNIRRVQRLDRKHEPVEMAKYDGLDVTCRPLINSIMQGGTVDVVTPMMLRCRGLCDRLGAKLLINIHDELVYEVPRPHAKAFVAGLRHLLAQPPGPDWRIPIVLEFKVGLQFGSMRKIP